MRHFLRTPMRRFLSSFAILLLLLPSFAQAATLLYVTHIGADNVSIVNIGTNQATGITIPVGDGPNDIVINGTGAYVTNQSADTVSVIDTTNNEVEATISVGDSPNRIAVSGTGVYVTNSNSNTVSVIDKANNQVESDISVGTLPIGIAIEGTGAYVTNLNSDNVSVIDITDNQVVTTIAVGDGPTAIAIHGTGAYVVNRNSDNVSVIDITDDQVVATIAVGDFPITIAISGTGGYVGNVNGNSLTVFDTTDNQVVTTVATGNNTTIMGINGTGAYLKAGGIADLKVFDIGNNEVETTILLANQLSGYGAFYTDSSTLAPTLTAPAFGASTTLCDDLTITYTLPETPLSGSAQLQFYNEDTHSSVTATLNNNASASFALDLENFIGVANVVSTTGGNSVVAGNFTVYLTYQDQYGNPAASVNNTNLTVTACAASSSSASSSSSSAGGNTGGGGGRRGQGTTTVYRSSSSSSSSSSSRSSSSQKSSAAATPCDMGEGTPAFTDVLSTDWFCAHARSVVALKIFEGYKEPDGTPKNLFGPADSITLGQLAKVGTILRNKEDLDPKPTGDAWYEPYVGAVQAYDAAVFAGTFDPLAPATRAQVIHTILEALQIPMEGGESSYDDVSSDTDYADAIASATALGFVSGDDGTENFRPNDPVNRAEVAKMIALALAHVGIEYEDDALAASSSASGDPNICTNALPRAYPVRATPSLSAPVAWYLLAAQSVGCDAPSNGWTKIYGGNATEGYVQNVAVGRR